MVYVKKFLKCSFCWGFSPPAVKTILNPLPTIRIKVIIPAMRIALGKREERRWDKEVKLSAHLKVLKSTPVIGGSGAV